MSKVHYDGVFTGRQAGEGVTEIDGMSHRYYAPDKGTKARLKNYNDASKMLDPEKHYEIHQARQFENYAPDEAKHWIPLDFGGMLSRLMREYTLGEEFAIRAELRGTQTTSGEALAELQIGAQREIDRITEASDIEVLLRQVAETLPAFGDAVVRIDITDGEDPDTGNTVPEALVRYVRPHHYHPTTDPLDGSRVTEVTLAWVFPTDPSSGDLMVLREIHVPGSIKYKLNHWDGKLGNEIPVESKFPGLVDTSTGIDEIPIVHFGFQTKAGEHYGNSEINRVQRLILAIENRLAQEDEVLEKHARPKLVVGPGVLDPEGRANLADFDVIEVTPDIFEKAVKPDYLTWDMQIEGMKHEIEKLEEYLFMTTETSPASFGLERDGSQVESARALRFKAHRTVNKVNDLRGEMSPGIKSIYRIAQKRELAARATEGGPGYRRSDIAIKFGDPIVEDHTQEVTDYTMRKSAGLVSRRKAIEDLDNITPAEAQAEVERILQDQVDEAAATTATLQPLDFDAGAAPGLGDEPATTEEPPRDIASDELGIAEDVQKVVLNGAQVSSMVQIATAVAKGELPRESALAIIETAFGLPAEEASRILAGTDEIDPPKPKPSPFGGFGAPAPSVEEEEEE
jgi:hypothetical protein